MDGLTAHYLARELDARWRGRRIGTFVIRRAPLSVTLGVIGQPAVAFELARRDPRARTEAASASAGPLDGYVVKGVSAPTDERRLRVELERPGKFRGSETRRATLELSFVPSARGVELRSELGTRMAAAGAPLKPQGEPRAELSPGEIVAAAAAGDVAALMRGRWMCGWLAAWLVEHPAEAAACYAELCALSAARSARCGGRVIPFPFCDSPEPVASLLDDASSGEAAPQRIVRRSRMVERLREELERARDAEELRAAADLLMAMGDEEAPPDVVRLHDGRELPVAPREGESAVAVAERLYRQARSKERALAALPARIAAAEAAERERAEGSGRATAGARGRDGAPEAGGPPPKERYDEGTKGTAPNRRGAARSDASARLPYRSYRSSGGLEIRVGRGAADNDELTFHASAPGDVWLHARDAGGAHVVLRWQRDEAPPARDLEEAAVLAAWHSRSRGSSAVAVDWTRRRYVRKPRGAKPGSVVVTRAETLTVRPSSDTERRLRDARD